jgi:hypothetical protein
MSRESVLARGRAFAAGGFTDACRIWRESETPDTHPLTGHVTAQQIEVYIGPCRVQQSAAPWAGPATVGDAARRLAALELQIPVAGTEGIRVSDRVTITACAHDVELVDRELVVVGEHHASHKTTRRLPLQEVLS